MQQIFKKHLTGIGVLWLLAVLFLALDIAGPLLGAPPTATASAGPLYSLTKNVPVAVNQVFFFHFFFYPLPLLLTFWLWWHIRKLKKAQLARIEEVAANSVSVYLGPPVDDTTAWDKSWGILADWHSLISELPQNTPKARREGYGLHSAFGYVSRVGDGVRLTARIPTPLATAAATADQGEPEQAGGEQSPKGRKLKAKKRKRSGAENDLSEIPTGLPQEFISLIKSRYEFCEVQVQAPGFDPLNLDAVKENKFVQRRKSIGEGKVVSAYRLLHLNGASYLGIKTKFLDDPTALIYPKLDLSNDSGLSACGIEIVCVPASEWQKEAQQAIQNFQSQEMSHQVASQLALSTTGGKSQDTSRAATSRSSLASTKVQREAIEKRLEEGTAAFCVWIYVWAEGDKKAVESRLSQLVNIFSQYTVAASPKTGPGQRFTVQKSGQGLNEVRKRAYPLFFAPEPSVLTVSELAVLWHIPNKSVRGPERAGAMSPPPAMPLVHRTILADGRVIKTDDKWRRVIGLYTQADGTQLEIGISEQGCLRGGDLTGRPGSGKSVDLETSIVLDTQRDDTANVGKGKSDAPWNSIVSIDPNGDFIYDTIDRLPDTHEAITAVIDPLDRERVAGLNPMAIPKGFDQEAIEAMVSTLGGGLDSTLRNLVQNTAKENARDGSVGLVASSMIEIFAKTQGVTMDTTPTIYRVISNAIRLSVEADSNATIWTLLRLINDEAYRAAMVTRTRDELLRQFWTDEFANMADKQGGSALAPTRSRLENLLRQESIRRLLTQRVRTVNLRQSIDKGHVLLFRFSPELGADKSFLLAVSFNLIKQAVFSRANIAKEQRRMVSVYLDEFQDILGTDASTLQTWLEQARKFGGAVTLAHQNLSQVKTLLEALKGTIGSFIPMLVGPDDRKFYAGYFDSAEWPREQIERAFAKLPPYSKVAKLYDAGQDFTPVLLRSLPRLPRQASRVPTLVALKDENTPSGYRIEPYNPTQHGEALRESKADGMEGFWEATEQGIARGISPATPTFCPNLIEEMTSFLHRKGQLQWGLHPFDMRGADLSGFNPEEIRRINGTSGELKEAQQLLLEVERMADQQEREDTLSALDERRWQLYRMSRKGRDIALRKVLIQPSQRSLIPEKRNRVLTLSRLWVGTPIAEIEAEAKRPDGFTVEAERIREKMMQEAEAAAASQENGKRGGGGGGKAKAKKAAV